MLPRKEITPAAWAQEKMSLGRMLLQEKNVAANMMHAYNMRHGNLLLKASHHLLEFSVFFISHLFKFLLTAPLPVRKQRQKTAQGFTYESPTHNA